MQRPTLLWRPHGGHPARIAWGPGKGTCGVIKRIYKNWWGAMVLEVAGDDPGAATRQVRVGGWRLGPIRHSDRVVLPSRRAMAPGGVAREAPLFGSRTEVDLRAEAQPADEPLRH